jgi:hypothetical protein
MIRRESLISLNLLNAMVEEILNSELGPLRADRRVPKWGFRQSHAEIVDEKLFRRTLLTMPIDKAPGLIQQIQPKFHSRRFSENCLLALKRLATFDRAA